MGLYEGPQHQRSNNMDKSTGLPKVSTGSVDKNATRSSVAKVKMPSGPRSA